MNGTQRRQKYHYNACIVVVVGSEMALLGIALVDIELCLFEGNIVG